MVVIMCDVARVVRARRAVDNAAAGANSGGRCKQRGEVQTAGGGANSGGGGGGDAGALAATTG
jgi:hypothetical protein